MANYQCSGDMPGAHVDCTFTCDTLTQAIDHFERTSHSVDATHSAEVIFDRSDVSWKFACRCGATGPARNDRHNAMLDAMAHNGTD